MATQWISPTWRMPENNNQSKVDNYSLEFNGTDEFIDLGNVLDNVFTSSSFTVSTWIYSTGNTSYDNFFNKGTTVQFYLFSNKIQIYLAPSGIGVWPLESTATLSLNTWYNIVFTRSGNENKLYINGTLDNSVTSTGSISSSTDSLTFSSYNGGSNYFWQGELSGYSIYDSALTDGTGGTENQIGNLYNSGTPVNPMALTPLPVAYYPLGGGSTGDADNPATTLTIPNDAVTSATVFDFTGGSGEYISTNSTALLNGETEASFNFWLKAESGIANFDGIICQRSSGGAYLLIHIDDISGSDYRIYIQQSNGSVYTVTYTPRNLSIDNWYQVCVKGSVGSKWDIYVNGSLNNDAQGANNIGGIVQDSALKIGQDTSGRELVGEMSNVQIWNKNLSTGNIITLYNNGVPLLTGTQPETANLKGWWKMNVDTSNWEADTSGDWQIANAVSLYPQSFNFDATSDIINFSTIDLGTTHTISMWVKISATSFANIITGTGGSAIKLNAPNKIYYYTNNYTNSQPSILMPLNQWNNIIIVRETTTIKFYVNNSLLHTTTSFAGDDFSFNKILGLDVNNQTSNIQLWDSALPATGTDSVETIYNNGNPLTTAIASSNLKAWYKLDNSATFSTNWSIPDASGNGNTGTSSGMTEQNLVNDNVSASNGTSSGMTTANLVTSDLTRSIPYSSYSMAFDGTASADYIDFGSGILGDESNLSISFWLKPNVVNDNDGVFTISTMVNSQNPLAFLLGSSDLKLYINSAYAWQQDFSSKADTWTHVLLSYDSATAANSKVYINGVEDAGDGTYNFATGNIDASGAGIKVIIGSYYTSAYSLDGEMSNVAVWNSSLSADQALTIYNGGVPNDISSLSPTGWWSLAGDSYYNGTDWICPDLSSSSNNGTSFNMPATALIGDGPGSTANGVATSMDIPANLKGDAPNSTKNAFSINMTAIDRVSGSGNVPG